MCTVFSFFAHVLPRYLVVHELKHLLFGVMFFFFKIEDFNYTFMGSRTTRDQAGLDSQVPSMCPGYLAMGIFLWLAG